jgi:hypothetical protein
LDICLSIDRCSIFYAKLKALSKYKPYIVGFFLFLISVLIGLPYFFVNCALNIDAPTGNNTYFRLWIWDITEFGRSIPGEILTYANFFIRDVLFLILEVALNIFTIILFRNYFRNKSKLLGNRNNVSHIPTNTNSTETTPKTTAQCSNMSRLRIKNSQLNNLSAQEKNLTFMIIIMSFFSIIIHIFYLVVGIALFFHDSLLTSSTGAFVAFTCILKHMSNIMFLFLFNLNFRKTLRKMFSF